MGEHQLKTPPKAQNVQICRLPVLLKKFCIPNPFPLCQTSGRLSLPPGDIGSDRIPDFARQGQ